MRNEQTAVRIDPESFEVAMGEATTQRMSIETRDGHKVPSVVPMVEQAAVDEDSILLDLVVRHFRDVGATPSEQRRLAAAMLAVIDRGESTDVGPIGRTQRYYRFARRAGAVRIRVGEGAINLPMAQAVRLAVLLQGKDRLQVTPSIAANRAS